MLSEPSSPHPHQLWGTLASEDYNSQPEGEPRACGLTTYAYISQQAERLRWRTRALSVSLADSGLTYSRQEKMAALAVSGLSQQVRGRRSWKPAGGALLEWPALDPQASQFQATPGERSGRLRSCGRESGGDAGRPCFPPTPPFHGMRAGHSGRCTLVSNLGVLWAQPREGAGWETQEKGDLSLLLWLNDY